MVWVPVIHSDWGNAALCPVTSIPGNSQWGAGRSLQQRQILMAYNDLIQCCDPNPGLRSVSCGDHDIDGLAIREFWKKNFANTARKNQQGNLLLSD